MEEGAMVVEIIWSPWVDLNKSWRANTIPEKPGLYRVRRLGRGDLDYIGETGSGSMTLRKRLAMLNRVYQDEMPYSDPHTAAPALWALRHREGCEFEVSVAPVDGPMQWRRALEAVAISLYRQQYGRSPTASFGGMPPGYRKSSGNNSKLLAAGKTFRGGPDLEVRDVVGSIAPMGRLGGDPHGRDWCGHVWSEWVQIEGGVACVHLREGSTGLYRLRGKKEGLLYVGQGRIKHRIRVHRRDALQKLGIQGQIFAEAGPLECSWVADPMWTIRQRNELENDLISAHVLELGRPPAGQFLGKRAIEIA
jgi:hypothetical protein